MLLLLALTRLAVDAAAGRCSCWCSACRLGVRGPIISSICTRHFAGPRVATIYGTIYRLQCARCGRSGRWLGGVLHDLTGGYAAAYVFARVLPRLAAMPFLTGAGAARL